VQLTESGLVRISRTRIEKPSMMAQAFDDQHVMLVRLPER
jgi:hypothetical protein